MAISMAHTIQEERLRWVRPVAERKVALVDVARVCPHSMRSLERWLKTYREGGAEALIPRATIPNTSPNETAIWIKERVIKKRRETKLCAQKLHWRLKKEGVSVPVRTIGKIISDEGLTRKYRVKKIKYKYIKTTRQPGELIEIDVKYVPGKVAGMRYFQYTAVDVASRWRHLAVFDAQTNHHAIHFLNDVIERFDHPVQAVKTDNHAIFTNRYNGSYKREDLSPRQMHAFDQFCARHGIIHYLIDQGKPSQNGTVERSHREDQEKFYDQHIFRSVRDLQTKLRRWNIYYNNLEHCGLNGKTPNEFLVEYKLTNPPNVLA